MTFFGLFPIRISFVQRVFRFDDQFVFFLKIILNFDFKRQITAFVRGDPDPVEVDFAELIDAVEMKDDDAFAKVFFQTKGFPIVENLVGFHIAMYAA